jgi:predicted ribosome quality control (RQC) complex YloA/Tae2 family protein
MALDGALLSLLKNEISERLSAARVDKVQQPERDEIDITFRLRSGGEKLLISANSNSPRVHLTQISKENPVRPPMFCMLLKKHLTGARFAGIRQPALERVLFLDFNCRNEFGDPVKRSLAVEMMGRRSNIVLLDEEGRILDAIKHIDESMSRHRQILPGLDYELPPRQNKLDLLEAGPEDMLAAIKGSKDDELPKVLVGACLLYTSPSPRDGLLSRMPSSA